MKATNIEQMVSRACISPGYPRPITSANLFQSMSPPLLEPPQITINKFTKFPELPTEIRLKTWSYAADGRDSVVISIQVDSSQVPRLLLACAESRRELLKRFIIFDILGSNRKVYFAYLEAGKDTLYINQRLNLFNRPDLSQPTSLHAAIAVYPRILREVQSLTLNVESMHKLTSFFRGGNHNVWAMLARACPKLKILMLRINGPGREIVRTNDATKLILLDHVRRGRDRRILFYTLGSYFYSLVSGRLKGVEVGLCLRAIVDSATHDELAAPKTTPLPGPFVQSDLDETTTTKLKDSDTSGEM